MTSIRQGTVRLCQVYGINVFLHWSWFLVALIEIQNRKRSYSSICWNVAEYLGLFVIVVFHEFGHALACRQTGGVANEIVLWPLGGVAYVRPPQRPGATLWSIAAGPLVNVVLFPVLWVAAYASHHSVLYTSTPDLYRLLLALLYIDTGLFIFNMLPIYPLDGGQILRSLLWFVLGRARSLLVATILGFVGIAGFLVLAFWTRSVWSLAIAVFMLMNCWGGLQHARALLRIAKLPRREGFSCPSCRTAPPLGEYWKCGRCGRAFDTFQTGATCPGCGMQYPNTQCLDCGELRPMSEWSAAAIVPR